MNSRFIRLIVINAIVICVGVFISSTFSQGQHRPSLGPLHRPRVQMIGFLNAEIAETETRPVVTLTLPADEKQYVFLIADMKILAGPLRTPGSILSEVKPFSPNFRIRTSQELIAELRSATPVERITITAEYSSADRVLFVQGVEKGEETEQEERKIEQQ